MADPYATLGFPLDEGVAALVNKSLLQPTEPWEGEARFLMLETLREYALERLAASGEEQKTRQAHAAYFLVLAEEGNVALASSDGSRWVKRFEAQHDDFRAALEWLTAGGNAEWALRLALGLFNFWQRGEHLAEGRRRLEALLAAGRRPRVPHPARAGRLRRRRAGQHAGRHRPGHRSFTSNA